MSLALAVRLDIDERAAVPARPTDEVESAADGDADLVARSLRGQRRAFEELVLRYQRPVFRLAMRYVKSEADAKDVTQRTFIQAFGALDRFRSDSTFRTWLFRIAINVSLNHLRARRRDSLRDAAAIDEAEGGAAPGGEIDRRRVSAELRRAVTELPPKQRMVIELRIYDELPFREVAELVGTSENAAKVSFHHAVKKLRERMRGVSR